MGLFNTFNSGAFLQERAHQQQLGKYIIAGARPPITIYLRI
jgi:hypothetical protein